MTKQKVQTVRTTGESIGAEIADAQDLDLGIVRGYMAGRRPALVEARKAARDTRIDQLEAQLLEELAAKYS